MRKAIRIISITLAFLIISVTQSKAQNGWVAGNWYMNQGGSDRTCGSVYSVLRSNMFSSWYEYYQDCRDRHWYQEYYSGYVYLWGPNGWYTQVQEGYFWRFNWNTFTVQVYL